MCAPSYMILNIVNAFAMIFFGKSGAELHGFQTDGLQYRDSYLDVMRRAQPGGFKYSGIGKRMGSEAGRGAVSGFTYAGIDKSHGPLDSHEITIQDLLERKSQLSSLDNEKRSAAGFKYSGIGKRDGGIEESLRDNGGAPTFLQTVGSMDKKAAGYMYAGIGKRSKETLDDVPDTDYGKRKALGRRNSFRYAGIGKREDDFNAPDKRGAATYRYAGLGKRVKGSYRYAGIGKRADEPSVYDATDAFSPQQRDTRRALAEYKYAGIGKRNSAFQYAGVGKRGTDRQLLSSSFSVPAGMAKRGYRNSMRYAGIGKRAVLLNDWDNLAFQNLVDEYDQGNPLYSYPQGSAASFTTRKRSPENKDQMQNTNDVSSFTK